MKIRLKHERLAEEMAKSPVTLNRWAQRMGLRSGHLSQLVNGKRPYPTARTRQKLLQALGLEFSELFEIETAPSSPAETRSVPERPRFSEAGATQPRALPRRGGKEAPMSGWWFDLRCAARSLVRRPGYTAAAVLTLAIGIGANVALFTAVNAILFKAYPYQEPERLFVAWSTESGSLSHPNAVDLQERLEGTLDLAVWDWEPFSLAGGDRPQRVGGGQVSSNLARVVGVPMLRGRFFTDREERDTAAVVVLGEALWRSSFGADPAIVGRQVLLDGRPVTVVGVAPATLDTVDGAELFVPLPPPDPEGRHSRWLGGYARLAQGVGLDAARDRLRTVAAQLEREYPVANEDQRYELVPLREERVAPVRAMFLILQGVVVVVLLIVCANLANLLFSRGAARGEELRLRAALGASRSSLIRLVLMESVWLALFGLLLGGVLGVLGSRALFGMIPADQLPDWLSPEPDFRVALYAVAATVLALLLSTVGPALRQSRGAGAGADGGQRVTRTGMRRGLVVAEVALSCILLFGAGLMIRSLFELTTRDPGFDRSDAVVVGLDLLSLRRAPAEERRQQFLRYYRAFEELPGVEAVGAIDRIPLGSGRNITGVTVEHPTAEDFEPYVLLSRVTPGYFEALGLPRLQGRTFVLDEAREQDEERHEAVISRSVAESFWPGDSAIGKRFKFGRPEDEVPWYEVRAVVGDVLHLGLDQPPFPTVYLSEGAIGMARAQWVVRGRGGAESLLAQLRETVASIDPNQPLWGVRSLERHVAEDAWEERFFAILFWVFAGTAAGLAAIGLYAVLAFAVAQRRREMGVRLALGASAGKVASLVVTDGLRLVLVGLAIGVPLALLLGRFLAGLLFGVSSFDLVVLAAVVALLLVVALLAVSFPARRASRLDPAAMLRVDG